MVIFIILISSASVDPVTLNYILGVMVAAVTSVFFLYKESDKNRHKDKDNAHDTQNAFLQELVNNQNAKIEKLQQEKEDLMSVLLPALEKYDKMMNDIFEFVKTFSPK